MRISIWDILFWVALAILSIWLVLKLTGIIQTPVWQDLLPLGFSAILLLLSAWGKLSKIDNIEREIRRINYKIEKVGNDLIEIKTEHNLVKQGKLKFHK